jgi:hypothetical protein
LASLVNKFSSALFYTKLVEHFIYRLNRVHILKLSTKTFLDTVMDYLNRKKVEKSPNDKFLEEKKVRRDRNVKELGKNEKNTSIAKKGQKLILKINFCLVID